MLFGGLMMGRGGDRSIKYSTCNIYGLRSPKTDKSLRPENTNMGFTTNKGIAERLRDFGDSFRGEKFCGPKFCGSNLDFSR